MSGLVRRLGQAYVENVTKFAAPKKDHKGLKFAEDWGQTGFEGKGQNVRLARFSIGQVVKHRLFEFRGVVFDVDPVFTNTEEWWTSIPEEIRPDKDQPFYHLLAQNERTTYVAYVSEQNLLQDESGAPIDHPDLPLMFAELNEGQYKLRSRADN